MYNTFLCFNRMKSVNASSYLEAAHCEGNLRSSLVRELNVISPELVNGFVYSWVFLRIGRDRGTMFSQEMLDSLMQRINHYLEEKKISPENRIQALQIFTKYLLIARASVFNGISDMDEATARTRTSLKPNLDIDFDKFIDDDPANQVSQLALEIKDMVLNVAFKDLSNDEILIDTVLQRISNKLASFEGVSPDIRIKFMQNVCKYLISAQLKLTEDREVEEAISERDKTRGLARIDKLAGARDVTVKKQDIPRAKNYLVVIHSLVAGHNQLAAGSDKIRPDIVDHVWCCDSHHSDGLPDVFRHTLPYLVYLRVMLEDVKSIEQIPTEWKVKCEKRFLLSEQEQSLFKLAMSGYFPKLNKASVSGVEKTVRRLLKTSKAGEYKDWFELLKERLGDEHEVINGITLKDLADKL